MKKGFTLIELLAVIVILAIIALIATPLVIRTINNAQEGANARSVEGYMKAEEAAYYENMVLNGGVEGTIAEATAEADYSGAVVACETVTKGADDKFAATNCTVDGKDDVKFNYNNGKAEKAA